MATIRRRNNKFQVQIRRLGFPPLSKSFLRRRDADEWARQMEVQADRRDLPVDRKILDTMKVGDLVRRYRDEVVPSKKGAEVETIVLNAFLRHPINDRLLSEITSAEFATYSDERLTKVTPNSLKRQLAPLGNMFEVAQREWSLPLRENPVRNIKLRGTDIKRERRLREGELERLIKAARARRNRHLLPIIQFALETAMRRGEILAMKWTDVDMERRSVRIPETKNGHSRSIPLTEKAIAALRSGSATTESVFPTTAVALRQVWDRMVAQAELEDLHFHDLRHEAISRFFEKGLSVPEVASVSGHRDIRMLMRYAHADRNRVLSKLDS